MKTPTFRELLAVYRDIAAIERAKCGSPCEGTVNYTVTGVKDVVNGHEDETLDWLTRRRLDEYVVAALARPLAPVSVWGYVGALRAVTARWTRPYYKDRGLRVPTFDVPVRRSRPERYRRPDAVRLTAVKKWYEALAVRADRRNRIAAMMMLEFAMRNGDVKRLSWTNFRFPTKGEAREAPVLCYTPHKTELSSGRVVAWPVHPDQWRELSAYRAALGERSEFLPHAGRVFRKLNSELRQLGFTGSKALYELRKICIDHVYQRFGAEMASSISGDDIRTVTRYYADPSAVTLRNVRVIDLL